MGGPLNAETPSNRKPGPSSTRTLVLNPRSQNLGIKKAVIRTAGIPSILSNEAGTFSVRLFKNADDSVSRIEPPSSGVTNNVNTLGVANAIRQKALQGDQNALASYLVHSLDNVVERLDILEKKQDHCNAMLEQMIQKKETVNKIAEPPICLPFRSTDELLAFDNADTETYNEVVSHFVYLGGINATDCAARYFKTAIDINEELLLRITWLGSKKTNQIKLSTTRFAKACEEAIGLNSSIRTKPKYDEFVSAMNKALKSTKERLRRRRMYMEDPGRHQYCREESEYEPPRQRRRYQIKISDEQEGNIDFIETVERDEDRFETIYTNENGEHNKTEDENDDYVEDEIEKQVPDQSETIFYD